MKKLDYPLNTHLEFNIFKLLKDKLLNYGYACGNYEIQCIICGDNFFGDKRASSCLTCVTDTLAKRKKHPYTVVFNGIERVLSKEDYETMEEHLHHL